MYDFTGCECPICHQPFGPQDDIVVCPECGAPYHRSCYESAGGCLYQAQHSASFEWVPPHQAEEKTNTKVCAVCGAENPAENRYCKNCGSPLSDQASASSGPRAASSAHGRTAQGTSFDYSQLYHSSYVPPAESPFSSPVGTIDPNEKLDGISAAEWASYVGPSSKIYLLIFKQMDTLRRKIAFSFSAMLFGPFYFAYRKAWKPAVFFGLLACLIRLPTFLLLLQASGSVVTAGLSSAFLDTISSVAYYSNFVIMTIRGLYGFYFYKRAAAKQIHRIQQRYPDTQKRNYVLSAQGGTSIAAVLLFILCFLLLLYLGMFLFVGPNISGLANALGYSLT